MKQLRELQLTAHQKEWMKIHFGKYKWSIERIRDGLRDQLGEDVNPDSIRKFVSEHDRLPVSGTAPSKRLRTNRQSKASQDIKKRLEADSNRADRDGDFDPKSSGDGKQKVVRAINLRRGQAQFRKELLRAYSGRCAITDCNCADALEAAHILPFDGKHTNHVQNGLLLRSDIHTLFDLGKIGVDAITKTVLVAGPLRATVYGTLKGLNIRLPADARNYPNEEVLRKHAKQWGLTLE
jgi:hypothetical protein